MAVKSSERRTRRSYAKGAERRQQLLDSAAELLRSRSLDELSLKDIAEHADIPVGSAYHFFANAYDLFVALAEVFMATLHEVLGRPYTDAETSTWPRLLETIIDRAARLYDENPAYRQLIIGPKTPPEIKLADRRNDELVGQLLHGVFDQHFVLDATEADRDVFFYATEIVDLLFSLSVIRHGRITADLLAEAKRAAHAYLASYLPAELARRETEGR